MKSYIERPIIKVIRTHNMSYNMTCCGCEFLLIPSALQDQVLKSLHVGPLGGHLGITRTEERVRKRFHWPGIRKTVTRHIQLCNVCNHKNSPTNRNTAPLGHISVSQPFTFWAMDYMGPLPETSRGNKHILVVVDHFTKWCEEFATPDQKSQYSCATFSKPHFLPVWTSRSPAFRPGS